MNKNFVVRFYKHPAWDNSFDLKFDHFIPVSQATSKFEKMIHIKLDIGQHN